MKKLENQGKIKQAPHQVFVGLEEVKATNICMTVQKD